MLGFFELIKDFFVSIFALFDSYTFTVGNFEVSYFALVFALLVIGMVVSIFWRGAKT